MFIFQSVQNYVDCRRTFSKHENTDMCNQTKALLLIVARFAEAYLTALFTESRPAEVQKNLARLLQKMAAQ